MSNEEKVVRPKVALFIDLDNIRFSFQQQYRCEPDLKDLVDKALAEGPLTAAFAYADFSRTMPAVRRRLETLGVICRDIPMRRLPNGIDGETRYKSSADHQMMLDIVETALDRGGIKTFILATGDSDFMRITTMLRNRFEKTVVVVGVPGSMAEDLIESVGKVIKLRPIEIPADSPIVAALVRLMMSNTPPNGFWTIPQLIRWAGQERNGVPGSLYEQQATITYMVQNGLINQENKPAEGDLTERRVSTINEDNEIVREILNLETAEVASPESTVDESWSEDELESAGQSVLDAVDTIQESLSQNDAGGPELLWDDDIDRNN